jgi:hypothetical protein
MPGLFRRPPQPQQRRRFYPIAPPAGGGALNIVKATSSYDTANNGPSVPYDTPSWTPVDGRGYVVMIHGSGLGTSARPLVTGNSQTWTFGIEDGIGGANYQGLFYTNSASGSTTGTLSVEFDTTASGCMIQVAEITGHDTADMIGNLQAPQGAATTTVTVDFVHEEVDSGVLVSVRQVSSDSPWTSFDGLTEIESAPTTAPNGQFTFGWANTPIDPVVVTYTTSANWRALGAEIKVGAGGGPIIRTLTAASSPDAPSPKAPPAPMSGPGLGRSCELPPRRSRARTYGPAFRRRADR